MSHFEISFKVKRTHSLLPILFTLFSFYVHLLQIQSQLHCTALVIEIGEVFSMHLRGEKCIEGFNQKRYYLGDKGVD
jgi:hypothetical protein